MKQFICYFIVKDQMKWTSQAMQCLLVRHMLIKSTGIFQPMPFCKAREFCLSRFIQYYRNSINIFRLSLKNIQVSFHIFRLSETELRCASWCSVSQCAVYSQTFHAKNSHRFWNSYSRNHFSQHNIWKYTWNQQNDVILSFIYVYDVPLYCEAVTGSSF